MNFDTTDILLSLLKIVIVLLALLNVTPIMVWVERRGSALIQDRLGPNRVGPFGLLQSFADALKFILKEDVIPHQAHKWLFTIAPMFGLIPAVTTFAAIPFGRAFTIPEMTVFGNRLFEGGRYFEPIVADLNIGILLIFALASLSVYGIVMAGWSSNNKYSLLGGVRASAQMISYELSLTLAAIGALMAAGSLRLTDVVHSQTGYFVLFDAVKIPAWNVFPMFIGFVVFVASGFAETNRLPFDLPEAEAELVAGYHTEYSSMKFAMFFMAEYMAMTTMSALIATLFLGGWDIPYYQEPANSVATMSALIATLFLGGWDIPYYQEPATFLGFLLSAGFFVLKIVVILFIFVWVRWTLPRFKYDQLMRLGWKVFLPMAIVNIVLVALFIAYRWV